MPDDRGSMGSGTKQTLSLVCTIAAIVLLTGLGTGTIEVFGTSVPLWLPTIALFLLGLLSGWLLGDQPFSSLFLRRRRR